MNDHSTTFEAVTSSMLKILKEDFSRTDSTLEGYAWKWNQLRQFMENNDLHSSPLKSAMIFYLLFMVLKI